MQWSDAMENRPILVVDDDPDIVDYLTSFLEDSGYSVRSAAGVDSALRTLEGFRPRAILIDVMMPGRSGLNLLVKLRRDSRYSDIPLLVVTGDDKILEDDCQSYLGSHQGVSGPDGVLGKPIDRETLLNVLEVLLNGKRPPEG
jgi:CheY-like chemotaxis protein